MLRRSGPSAHQQVKLPTTVSAACRATRNCRAQAQRRRVVVPLFP